MQMVHLHGIRSETAAAVSGAPVVEYRPSLTVKVCANTVFFNITTDSAAISSNECVPPNTAGTADTWAALSRGC